MASRLILPASIYTALLALAQAGAPDEVCGLLRGRNGRATEFLPARNVAPDPRCNYEIDPQALLNWLDWEAVGDELIALYHSHPASVAYPSAADIACAVYPDAVYLICSLAQPGQPVLRGYRLRGQGAAVEEIEIVLQPNLTEPAC